MTEELKEEESDLIGSLDYISPEGIEFNKNNLSANSIGFPTDLWALGVIIYQIFHKENMTPFASESQQATFEKIRCVDYEIPHYVPKEAADLISRLLVTDPSHRLGAKSMSDLTEHAFFEGIQFDALYDMLPPLREKDRKLGLQQ